MPFDIGIGEWVVIAVIALIVVGPEDLPRMFRKLGNWFGRIRAMSDEFRRTLDSAVDDSGIKTIRDDIKQTEIDLRNAARLEELESEARAFENDIRGDMSVTNRAVKEGDLSDDELDALDQQAAKARVEHIRAKSDAIQAEARAKSLRAQLAKAEADLEIANAKASADLNAKAAAVATQTEPGQKTAAGRKTRAQKSALTATAGEPKGQAKPLKKPVKSTSQNKTVKPKATSNPRATPKPKAATPASSAAVPADPTNSADK